MKPTKAYLGLLARLWHAKGLDTVVISPGSRNAPLIQAFCSVAGIRCLSIPDERSAAYFALGLALRHGRPAAVVCTSGTAALNYAPAVAEAYYQEVPLLVLTADRPAEWIDKGDGQALPQERLYEPFVRKSFRYPQHITGRDDLQGMIALANEAYDATLVPAAGPVHVNFPFTEPLYDLKPDLDTPFRLTRPVPPPASPDPAMLAPLAREWHEAPSKMLLAGMMPPDPILEKHLSSPAQDPSVVLLTETTSNLYVEGAIPGIDKVVSTITEAEAEAFRPELLVTFGGHVVSKMIKRFLRDHPPQQHWHISPDGKYLDTFHALTRPVRATAAGFFGALLPRLRPQASSFAATWHERDRRSERRHRNFLSRAPFSDLTAFALILERLPEGSSLHLANSTPVRYSQLYRPAKRFRFFSNRGVSGIDGCTSTAAGAALDAMEDNYLITGDIAFFYDRNGLWHAHVSRRLKIILINNGGGGIFRFLDGPGQTGHLDLFETSHDLHAHHVARLYGLKYLDANDEESLGKNLDILVREDGPALLEVFTPRESNGEILKAYFENLKKT